METTYTLNGDTVTKTVQAQGDKYSGKTKVY